MSPSKETPPPPKLGIKGFSLSAKPSASKSSAKKVPPSSNLGKRARTTFQHDSESEDEEGRGRGKGRGFEAVTGFGDEGAERRDVNGGAGKGELVIKSMKNRDWRGEMKQRDGGRGQRKDLLPAEERARRDAGGVVGVVDGEREVGGEQKKEGVDVVNGDDGAITWGLSVRKRARTEDAAPGDDSTEMAAQTEGTTSSPKPSPEHIEEQPSKPQTADEEALASLLGAQTSSSKPILTIPAASAAPPLSEQETYRLAVLSAPDPSSLEDYERIPVEEFGAALLRGMGWKGEKNANSGVKKEGVKRRQNLLGLGAKELDGAEELGAWVQKSDVKRLNPGGGGKGGGFGGGERRPKASEYKREKERERERREERGGGGYRREKERDRERERDGGRDRRGEYRR